MCQCNGALRGCVTLELCHSHVCVGRPVDVLCACTDFGVVVSDGVCHASHQQDGACGVAQVCLHATHCHQAHMCHLHNAGCHRGHVPAVRPRVGLRVPGAGHTLARLCRPPIPLCVAVIVGVGAMAVPLFLGTGPLCVRSGVRGLCIASLPSKRCVVLTIPRPCVCVPGVVRRACYCVHVCVCVYIHVCVCALCTYACARAGLCGHMCIYTHWVVCARLYVCMCVCRVACVCECVYTCVHVCVRDGLRVGATAEGSSACPRDRGARRRRRRRLPGCGKVRVSPGLRAELGGAAR